MYKRFLILQVLQPLEIRYKEIVENGNLKTIYMEERVRGAVIDLLESFIGVVQGCHVSTVHQGYTYSIAFIIP